MTFWGGGNVYKFLLEPCNNVTFIKSKESQITESKFFTEITETASTFSQKRRNVISFNYIYRGSTLKQELIAKQIPNSNRFDAIPKIIRYRVLHICNYI